jgi:hypothetical protein
MEATYTISGKEYITTDWVITLGNSKTIKSAYKKFGIIEKEIKQIDRGSLFRRGFVIISVYIPLDKLKEVEQYIEDGMDDKKISKHLMFGVVIGVAVIGVCIFYYYFKKRFLKDEPNKKPNIFKRFKLWWNKKFCKKTELSPAIESNESEKINP